MLRLFLSHLNYGHLKAAIATSVVLLWTVCAFPSSAQAASFLGAGGFVRSSGYAISSLRVGSLESVTAPSALLAEAAIAAPEVTKVEEEAKINAKEEKELAKAEAKKAKELAKAEAKKVKEAKEAEEDLAKAEAKKAKKLAKAEAKKAKEMAKAKAKEEAEVSKKEEIPAVT